MNYHYPAGGNFELPNSVPDHVTWTNLMPASKGLDMQSQIAAKYPAYDPVKYGTVSEFYGVSGNYAIFIHPVGGQDTPCWVFLVNVHSGIVEQGFNSWDGTLIPILRWGGCHTGEAGAFNNSGILDTKPAYLGSTTALYGGPFNSKVVGVYGEAS